VTDYRTITSDIGLIELRKFPDVRKSTIGIEDGTSFVPPSFTPGPSYFPDDYQPDHNYHHHLIASAHDLMPDYVPGPASYEPNDPGRPSSAIVVMKSGTLKRFHDLKREDFPGPGEYQVGGSVRKAPTWSQKLRIMPKPQYHVNKIELKPWEGAK
jgi:hypothetical protein